jgi:hypothetical protein
MNLRKYSSDVFSDTAQRITNLFTKPNIVEVQVQVSTTDEQTQRFESRFLEENLIHRTSKGEAVRSKSEVIIADQLAAKGVEYVYEKPLSLNGSKRYPDFTIEDEDSGLTFYWEHCGLLHNPKYRQRWEEKKQLYRQAGILPYEESEGLNGTLIETHDDKNGGISSQQIAQIIDDVILKDL